jgi:hypothetical protein
MTRAPDTLRQGISTATVVAGGAAAALTLLAAGLAAGVIAPVGSLYVFDAVQFTVLSALVAALWRVVATVGNDDLAATAWRVLLVGWTLFLLGEASLVVIRAFSTTGVIPLPSAAEAFFIPGQVIILVGFALHLVAYIRIGMPLGGTTFLVMAAVAAVVGLWVVFGVLTPVWMSPTESFAGKATTTTYEALDLLSLMTAVPLFRIALLCRGGSIAGGWAAIALGFALMMVGDLLFGLHQEVPAGFAFVGSYTAIAFGVIRHRETIGRILVT